MSEKLIEDFINGRCWSDISSGEASKFINQSEEHIRKMVELSVCDLKDVSWRVAWLLGQSISKSSNPIQKYHLKIIKGISEKESGHQRELLKLVIDKNLSEEEEGRLFEVCIEIWKDIHKKPGTRSYAFKFIHQVVLKYPEIKNELVGLFESEYLETLSPAIKNSIEVKLNKLNVYLNLKKQ
ncbi:MAG: hypothetical protein P8K10_05210 [Crocinitomicaceae bacterium]|nr:hypothetical protein [Crocinitomicaceae bacterium]